MASSLLKHTLLSSHYLKRHSLSSLPSPPPSDQTPHSQTTISTAVSILQHHRSKSRWTELRSLFPGGFEASEVSQITLQLRNNPHLALRFFLFTHRHSLSNHTLLSYSTIIHILSRARLKTLAQTIIRSTFRLFDESQKTRDLNYNSPSSDAKTPKIFETLIKTYRTCDSAPFVFDLLVKACLQSKRIDQAIEVVRMLRSRSIYPMVSTCNLLIQSVSKIRGCFAGFDIYREVFRFDGEVEKRGGGKRVFPNANTFNVLMISFYRNGLMENVEQLWIEMVRLNCVPNPYSYSVLMAAYCDDGKMEEAMKLWEEMEIKGVEQDVVAYNTIIGGFCRLGAIERAEVFFREMELGGIESSCVTFEHLINGYCKIGDVDSALLLYKDMCRKGFRPEGLTIDALIGGLCDKGMVSEALEFLRVAVKHHEVGPREKSFEFLIKGLCQEGKMEEALQLQGDMVGNGFKPNSEIYNTFIDGYLKQGNKDLAAVLRKEMVETQMQQEDD